MDVDFSASITADIEGSETRSYCGEPSMDMRILNRDTGQINYLKKVWDESDGPGKGERGSGWLDRG